MAMQPMTFAEVRGRMQPGDVVAFGGDNPLSEIIMKAGKSTVSHVGLIVSRGSAAFEPRYIEATVRFEKDDPTLVVITTSFRARLAAYEGRVWWLPLSAEVRANFREHDFLEFCHQCEGKAFDLGEGIGVVMQNALGDLPAPVVLQNDDLLFCSELVVGALQHGGVAAGILPSRVSPATLCRWSIYDDTYALLKGDPSSTIPGFNTMPLAPV